MSDCLEGPDENRRVTVPRKVKFTVSNPDAEFSQEAIDALARLLLSMNRQSPTVPQENFAA